MSEEKIKPEHRQRLAVVYIRQSSPGQVKNHRESYRVQKGLTDRAAQLGWPKEKIKIVEGDQGESASSPQTRDDFNSMLQLIQDKQVGIVFGIDVSRLARNTLDWSLLTHWCALHDALLGDESQLYDPSLSQDSLVLGIQGVLAVHELHSIRNRLFNALQEKAGRGELHHAVPRGYVVVEGKHLRKHPDRRVQQAIDRVFERFTTCSSVSQLLVLAWERNWQLPKAVQSDEGRQVQWSDANHSTLLDMLQNPKYAGIYVYPRYKQGTNVLSCGKVQKTSRLARPEEWEIVLKDHHPAYITPAEYEANQEKIAMNAQRFAPSSRGAPNKGTALLAGLIECRRCEHKMQVHYSSSGRVSYYCRQGRRQRAEGVKGCFRFPSEEPERQLSEQILYAVSPAGVRAAEIAIQRIASERDVRRQHLSDQLEQLRYEADLTRRRFDNVDPANRLVFDTLAEELEVSLQAIEEQEDQLAQFDREEPPRPTVQERERLHELGLRLDEVWHGPQADSRLKQQVVRLLIEHVYAELDESSDEVVLWVKWSGGHHTELRGPHRRLSHADVDLHSIIDTLRKIADDQEISRSLNRSGVLTDRGATWTQRRVSQYRKREKIDAFSATAKKQNGWLSQQQAATYLEISPMSLNRLIQRGILPVEGTSTLPQVIRRDDLGKREIQEEVRRIKSHGNSPLPKNPNQKTLFQ